MKKLVILFLLAIILINGCGEEESEIVVIANNSTNDSVETNIGINETNTSQETETNTTEETNDSNMVVACYFDSECNGTTTITNYCIEDEIWKETIAQTCFKPGELDSFCGESTGSVFVQHCVYGCNNTNSSNVICNSDN